MMQVVLSCLCELKTIVDFIPSGYFLVAQSLDVSINAPFKIHYKTQYNQWYCSEYSLSKTNVTNSKVPEQYVVVSWTLRSWEAIRAETTVKT